MPVYYHVVQSIVCFESRQFQQCAQHITEITPHLLSAFKIYYQYVTDSKISLSVFTAYIQGSHGWAAGEIIDGTYVEYDGTSGANMVMFVMLDYFLGLEPFLKEHDFPKYFSYSQRSFLASIKQHSFTDESKNTTDSKISEQFEKISKQLRVSVHQLHGKSASDENIIKTFRSAHRKRTRQYLSVERPERVVMTAGSSLVETPGRQLTALDLADSVDAGLEKHMIQTS